MSLVVFYPKIKIFLDIFLDIHVLFMRELQTVLYLCYFGKWDNKHDKYMLQNLLFPSLFLLHILYICNEADKVQPRLENTVLVEFFLLFIGSVVL